MEEILFSKYSIPFLFDSISSLIITIFIFFRKDEKKYSNWLGLYFLIQTIFVFSYFLSYSILDERIVLVRRFLAGLMIFGNCCLISFSLNYPEDNKSRSGKYLIGISFLIAGIVYFYFVLDTFWLKLFYDFENHSHIFEVAAISTMLLNFNTLINSFISIGILLYKIIKYSSKEEAESIKSYVYPIIGFTLLNILGILTRVGKVSYDDYVTIFTFSYMVITYWMAISYINNLTQPTSFMVKLVSISLLTILLFMNYGGELVVKEKERDYEEKKLMEVLILKELIVHKTKNYPVNVEFVQEKNLDTKEVSFLYRKEFLSRVEESDYGEIKSEIFNQDPRSALTKLFNESPEFLDVIDSSVSEIGIKLERNLKYRKIGKLYFICYSFFHEDREYEIGFSYLEYRKSIHKFILKVIGFVFFVTLFILIVFPIFFKKSLVNPLDNLLGGLIRVNAGDLSVEVKVKYLDEIGFLSRHFNSLVSFIRNARERLIEYADHLEDKVKERTYELSLKVKQISDFKIQQDGDYYLASLVVQPLSYNTVKSDKVKIDYIISQKKKIEFKSRFAELGGDLCIASNVYLGKEETKSGYIFAMNADAMGKSMQGAGGAIVTGVVTNSFLNRVDKNSNLTPEEWLYELYNELEISFNKFNGFMAVSLIAALVEEDTGVMYIINSEHPNPILLKSGKASLFADRKVLPKIGFGFKAKFRVQKFQLEKGDIVLFASDGRDDIAIVAENGSIIYNRDRFNILSYIEIAEGVPDTLLRTIEKRAILLDDFSAIAIRYSPDLNQG